MCQQSSSEDLIDRHPWLLFSRGKIIELLTEYNHNNFSYCMFGVENKNLEAIFPIQKILLQNFARSGKSAT